MNVQKKYRVAVVGCGMMAQAAHLPNCKSNPRIDLVAVCDLNEAVAKACRETFGARRFETDWRKVVAADDIDLCILATHTNLRGEFIIPAIEAGKAVYTEKPLAPSRAEMVEIIKATRRTGRPVCVGHNRRSSPAILEFKRLLDRAAGDVPSLPPSIVHTETPMAALPEQRGRQILMRVNDDIRTWKEWIFWDAEGIMFAEMVHFIDLALWFNPGHPVRAFAEGSPRGNFTLLLRFDDGSLTTLQHTMVGHFDYPKELIEATTRNIIVVMEHHLEVRQFGMADEPPIRAFPFTVGDEVVAKPGMHGFLEAAAAERVRAVKTGEKPRCVGVNKGHALQLDRFLTHLDGKGENPCPVDSAVAVNRIALKFLESARLGLPVAVGPEDWHIPA